jgi:hypothetical protein
MTPDEAVLAVLDAFEQAGIAYMVVGSLASNFHGIPRSTRDADFVIELRSDTLRMLSSALPPGLTLQTQTGFEGVTGTTLFVIELAQQPFVCELFVRSDDPHDTERFSRRMRVTMFGRPVWIATAEDMIVTKLRWAADARRLKDRDDIRNMVAVRQDRLDWTYINQWAARHGTSALLEEIRSSVPPL